MKREMLGWIVAGVLAVSGVAIWASGGPKDTPLERGVVWHESAELGIAHLRFEEWLNDGENDPHSTDRRTPNGYTTDAPTLGDSVTVLGERDNGMLSVRFENGPRAGLVMDWPRRWVKAIK